MKLKMILLAAIVFGAGAGVAWIAMHHAPASSTVDSGGRKALYYTCAMHPRIRESNPGPCPVCGMNLTPVYGNESRTAGETNAASGAVTLEPESISTINVQTELAERRPVLRTLHLSGEIAGNSSRSAWFEFTAYERDLAWLKTGQDFEVSVPSAPQKVYHAQIKTVGAKPFADTDFDMMSGSTRVRAEISNPPVQPGDFGKNEFFNNLHAEAHLVAETEAVLTVPRGAVISRGDGPLVYVDTGYGHYEPREVLLGRAGNDLVEILGGLTDGERVVTAGNVLIDSEAQLRAGE